MRSIKKYPMGVLGAIVVFIFILVAIYAPFLASSKPFVVSYDGVLYFPLFRYLFYQGFYTKPLDLFFNLMIFTLPLALIGFRSKEWLYSILALQMVLFSLLMIYGLKDPAQYGKSQATWKEELSQMNDYARLNLLLNDHLGKRHHQHLRSLLPSYPNEIPSRWNMDRIRTQEKKITLQEQNQKQELQYLEDRESWIHSEEKKLHFLAMPLIRPFHWEDDAGGDQNLNQKLPWTELTRIHRKDLVAALLFGTRISLVVGFLSVALAILIAIPVGAYAGYYGGKFDIIVSRLLEIWESMPTFFMLLLVVAMLQNKSIFLVIAVIGLFGWTGFSRYIRGEFFKQRSLAYVDACRAIGFSDKAIIFRQILPNAIPPLLTLMPFAIMAAISSEAGLSFLGLGEEGSTSWGVLMDEGRAAFPGEAYLLWPPAILLTILLIAIALVGDALRDALDPKLKQ